MRGILVRLLHDIAEERSRINLSSLRLAPVQGILFQLVLVFRPADVHSAADLALVAVLVLELQARGLALREHRILDDGLAGCRELAELVLRKDQQVSRGLRNRRVHSYSDLAIAARGRSTAHRHARAIRPVQLRLVVFTEIHLVSVDVELVSRLRDLDLSSELPLIHVGVLEAQGGLFGRPASADALVKLGHRLARALGAAIRLLARVRR
mmetsp:Transcript_91191/g.260926  ORF Transcript_91191/g.260926 Transcript_91191/m.260926 type:complete len:210 (-) Transcript_91191:794-1423(-)